MTNIFDKLDIDRKNRVQRFEELVAKGQLTEREKRQLEMTLLKPDSIPKYTGKRSRNEDPVGSRTLIVVFDEDTIDIATRHLAFSRYTHAKHGYMRSLKDNRPIRAFLNALDSGEITYDKNKKELRDKKGRTLGTA